MGSLRYSDFFDAPDILVEGDGTEKKQVELGFNPEFAEGAASAPTPASDDEAASGSASDDEAASGSASDDEVASGSASDDEAADSDADGKEEEFIAAQRFNGMRERYIFTSGSQGLGYYLDKPPGTSNRDEADQEDDEDGDGFDTLRDEAFDDEEEEGGGGAPLPEVDPETGPKSKFERQQRKLADAISKLEQANVGPKKWETIGEVQSGQRPENSLLETTLDFQTAGKQKPTITQVCAASLRLYGKSPPVFVFFCAMRWSFLDWYLCVSRLVTNTSFPTQS